MSERAQSDLAAQPLTFTWAWGLPAAILIGAGLGEEQLPLIVYVIAVSSALVWMGMACLVNARRCRRLHCFISGPVYLIGAVAAMLIGLGMISAGPLTVEYVVWVTVGFAILSHAPEFVLGKYLR